MTGTVLQFTGAPFGGKPIEECKCVSQRLSGREELDWQKAIQGRFARSYHFGKSSRVFQKETAFEMLEPCALKGACTVLRGLGAGNSPRLLDQQGGIPTGGIR